MGILLFELFRNPLFMGILNKWETLVTIFTTFVSLTPPSTTTYDMVKLKMYLVLMINYKK